MNLDGLKINFLGDSITEGVGVSDTSLYRFDSILKRECNLAGVSNYGIGGTRIAHQTQPGLMAVWDLDFCGRAFRMDPAADIFVVLGGYNDYFHGDAPFGTPQDTTRITFCGSVRYLCKTINELYPNKTYVFIAPARVQGDLGPSQSQYAFYKTDARPMKEYVDAIMAIAPMHGFHAFSLYDELGLDLNSEVIRAKYTSDGLHFNDLGHRLLADKVKEFLQRI